VHGLKGSGGRMGKAGWIGESGVDNVARSCRKAYPN
jgi:hypothetical protein